MADLPLIQLPMPEEEQPKTLYGYITNSNEPPKYDDIMNSNLPREEKARQIQYRTQAYQDDLDRQLHKDYARMGAGTALSAASFHPFFNIPYVGTGLGGAMYDLGQGIVEGDTAGDLAKRAGRGFVIGETIGAVPYVGKAAGKTKAGQAVINSAPVQAVGNVLNKAGEKFANSKLYDALMTDVRAFDPNKQTAYHGSPYDFNKFSNEAIGTGEGAQAHGYGHYAALNKDVAEGYADKLGHYSLDNPDKIALPYGTDTDIIQANYFGKEEQIKRLQNQIEIQKDLLKTDPDNSFAWQAEIDHLNTRINNLNKYYDKFKLKADKQLYKLSVPKDDVMLREDLPFSQQPKQVQEALKNIANNQKDWANAGYTNFWEYPNDEFLNQIITGNAKGKEAINLINNLSQNRTAAEPLLNKYGVKGISYNGGIDGEARVIFNPDDIVIGRKYYNQPNLYQQLTGKQNTGALVDALFNR